MLFGAVGFIVLIVVGGFAIQCLLQALFLKLAARFCNVEGATFRRAFATAVAMAIVLTAIEFGVWVLLPVSPETGGEGVHHLTLHPSSWGFPAHRVQPAAFERAVIGIAMVGSMLASISLVKSGFRTSVLRALAVWFLSLALTVGTILVLIFLVIIVVFAIFAVIALV